MDLKVLKDILQFACVEAWEGQELGVGDCYLETVLQGLGLEVLK